MSSLGPSIARVHTLYIPRIKQSHKRRAAVYHDGLAGDEARGGGGQENRYALQLAFEADAAERGVFFDTILDLRQQFLGHAGGEVAGGDGVDADAAAAPACRQLAGHGDEA